MLVAVKGVKCGNKKSYVRGDEIPEGVIGKADLKVLIADGIVKKVSNEEFETSKEETKVDGKTDEQILATNSLFLNKEEKERKRVLVEKQVEEEKAINDLREKLDNLKIEWITSDSIEELKKKLQE